MKLTRTRFLRFLKISVSTLAIALIVGYVVARSLPYARGPIIQVFQPLPGTPLTAQTVDVVGRAERVNSLTLNGNQISLDEQGNFKETITVFHGVNIITLGATDQFGRSESDQIEVLGL